MKDLARLARLCLAHLPWILVWPGQAASESAMDLVHLSAREGLSQNSVYALLQDHRGFLWLGTEDGLNRYSGHEFEIFRPDRQDPASLSHNHITALHQDASGEIWIGTLDGQIDRYSPRRNTFSPFLHDLDLSGAFVNSIVEDQDGTLWIGTYGNGLYLIDAARTLLRRHPREASAPSAEDRILTLYQDQEREIWIGSENGLVRFDVRDQRFVRNAFSDLSPDERERAVSAIFEDQAGVLWAGTSGGQLRAWDRRTQTTRSYLCPPTDPSRAEEHRVVAIFEDGSGRLWIATSQGGLRIFNREAVNRETASFLNLESPALDDLADDYILGAMPDQAGNLWIATLGDGVKHLHWQRKPFEHIGDTYVYSVLEDRSGTLWVGTEGNGLGRRRIGEREFSTFRASAENPDSLADNTVWVLYEDSYNDLWIGTRQGGLDRMDRDRETFIHYPADDEDPRGLRTPNVRTIHEDRAGTLWVSTVGGALHRRNRQSDDFDAFVVAPDRPDDLYRNTVTALLETRNGDFWVGTLRGGALFDREQGTFTPLPEEATGQLDQTRIRALHESQDGQIWIATQGEGLFHFNPQTRGYRAYRVTDGLPNNVIYGILEEDDGHLWLSTNLGLSRFDPNGDTFRNYDSQDGLQSNEFNAGAFHRGRGGKFYFGGVGGVSAFHPREIRDHPSPTPVVLTDFLLDNKTARLGQHISEIQDIRLGYQNRVISFEFATLNFVYPEKSSYAYLLENFEQEWVPSGHRRFATYTNLPAGDYRFRVKATNSDGVWNDSETQVRLRVDPAPWRTLWAYALYAVALAGAAFGLVRSQRKKLDKAHAAAQRDRQAHDRLRQAHEQNTVLINELRSRNDELAQFSFTMSHDLRNPLVTIQNFLGLVRRDAEQRDMVRLDRDLDRIHEAADEMHHRLRNLLEFTRLGQQPNAPERLSMDVLIHEVAQSLSKKIEDRGVHLAIDPRLPMVIGDRGRLRVVFHGLIENAVKFMGDQPHPRVSISGCLSNQNGLGQASLNQDRLNQDRLNQDRLNQDRLNQDRLNQDRLNQDCLFTVSDNGVGIAPRYQQKIFGLFDQLEATKRDGGAGLALARRIIESHGGKIWVESEGEGQGSRFCLTLPSTRTV